MKKFIIAVAAVMFATASMGALISYDSFSDSVQTNWALPSSVPSTWSTTSAIPNSARPYDNRSQITAGSLSYPGLQASAGNSWTTHQGADDYYKNITGITGLTAGDQVYYSFLLKVNPSDTVTQYSMRLYNTANFYGSSMAFSIGILATDLTKMGFSIGSRNYNYSTGANSLNALTGYTYDSSATYLIVAGFSRGADLASSSVSLWVNPDSSTFGTATPPTPTLTIPSYNYALEATWNKLEYNFNGSGTGTDAGQTIDEFRIATDWANVVPAIPEPATVGMLGLGALVTLLVRRLKS